MNRTWAALTSIGAVVGAGLIGAQFGPQRPSEAVWYARLRKPRFTPPGPAIGAAWTLLEGALGVAGYRLLRRADGLEDGARLTALGGWLGTVAGLAGFNPVFFGTHRLDASTATAAGMFAASTTTAVASVRVDRVAMVAMLPIVAWTGFALLLSEEIQRRND